MNNQLLEFAYCTICGDSYKREVVRGKKCNQCRYIMKYAASHSLSQNITNFSRNIIDFFESITGNEIINRKEMKS